jgi:hypothetical protein
VDARLDMLVNDRDERSCITLSLSLLLNDALFCSYTDPRIIFTHFH